MDEYLADHPTFFFGSETIMRNAVLIFLVFFATPVFADEISSGEEIWTIGGGSDLGVMFKNRDAGTSNMLASIGLAFLVDVDVSERLRLGFGLGITSTIGPSISIPLSARFFPFGARRSGIYVQAQMTPMLAYGSPCAWSHECDVPFPDIDEGRLYRAVGVAGKAGAGIQINWRPVWVYLDAAIMGGPFIGLETKDGDKLTDGIYAGAEMTLGVRFPL